MRVVDAGVEYRDPDAFAGDAGVLHGRGADVRHSLGEIDRVVDHRPNRQHARLRR